MTHPSGKTRAGPRVALAALAGATCPAVLALAGAAAVLFAHLRTAVCTSQDSTVEGEHHLLGRTIPFLAHKQ